jgi:hypothetical protein
METMCGMRKDVESLHVRGLGSPWLGVNRDAVRCETERAYDRDEMLPTTSSTSATTGAPPSCLMTVVLPPLVPQLPPPGILFASPTLLTLCRLRNRPCGRTEPLSSCII